MTPSLDYQLALDPFREPDLFDQVDEPESVEPDQTTPDETPLPGHWDQAELDLDVPMPPTKALQQTLVARDSLKSMVDLALDRGNADSIGDLLSQVARLRQHKPFNALLAILQRPHATYLLTAGEWERRWQRRIRPGEHPLVLLFPHGPVRFVFDVSQTEAGPDARPLPPHLRNPFAMLEAPDAAAIYGRLVEKAKEHGVRVSDTRAGYPSAGCISTTTQRLRQRVVKPQAPAREVEVRWEVLINDSFNDTEKLATLAHELGHLYCGHVGARQDDPWPSRRPDHPIREFEAETTAILAFERLAPGVSLPDYLDQFFEPGHRAPDAAWDLVVRAASRIIDMCG